MAKILIIDDELNFRTSIKLILEKQKHTVLEASNGMEGLYIIEHTDDIDIIILDVVMPQKGGIDTLIDLKSKIFSHEKSLNIIISTGQILPQSKAFETLSNTYGAKAILYKPYEKSKLLETIDNILNNKI